MEPLDQPSPPLPVPPSFINRRGWLVAFGILELLIAAALLLMGLSVVLIPKEILNQSQQPGAPKFSMIPIMAFYVALGTVWAVLGVGSIMARNWARVISLVASYLWLVCGVMAMVVSALIMPTVLRGQPNMPQGSTAGVILFLVLFLAVFFVLLPGVMIIFYHRKNVRATCLAGRPEQETKRPILMTVLIALFAMSLVAAPISLAGPYPAAVFGFIIFGLAGRLIYLVYFAAEGIALWGYLKYDIRGWWTGLLVTSFWTLSSIATIARGNLFAMYRQMGTPEKQIDMIQKTHMLGVIWTLVVVYACVKLVAIVYSRRYFVASETTH